MLRNLVEKCRSYRRFYQEEEIAGEELEALVDLARLTASAANAQVLRFKISSSKEENGKIFETIKWAAALPDWEGPEEGERPAAYIVILCDLALGKNRRIDTGIAAQTIMLGAVEKGYGGCMVGSFHADRLADALGIDAGRYCPELILALGRPKETVVVVPAGEDGDVAYYRDENQVHYVPKRELKDLLLP